MLHIETKWRKLQAELALLILITLMVYAQQVSAQSAPTPANSEQTIQPQTLVPVPEQDRIYTVGSEVTFPVLLPIALHDYSNQKCGRKMDGMVILSMLIDAKGQPRNIELRQGLESALDQFAVQLVSEDRFKPATYADSPVMVTMAVQVKMQTCIDKIKDSTGKKDFVLRMRSAPEQQFFPLPAPIDEKDEDSRAENIGGNVTSPVVIHDIEPTFTNEARRAKLHGTCIIGLIVDEQGFPRQVKILRPLGKGLDEKAIEAVRLFRFKPAMKNGTTPVPVRLTIEINFHLY